MPLPAIVGGSIIKVGGSLATAAAINAIIAALTKLKLPKSKIVEILIDKILDYALNQVTGGGASAKEELILDPGIISTNTSIEIDLPEKTRAIVVNVSDYPVGIGRRFSDTNRSSLPNKFLFGAVSFGGNTTVKDAAGDDQIFDVGLSTEEEIVWEKQSFNVPPVGKDGDRAKAFLYVLPNISITIDVLRVKTD